MGTRIKQGNIIKMKLVEELIVNKICEEIKSLHIEKFVQNAYILTKFCCCINLWHTKQ